MWCRWLFHPLNICLFLRHAICTLAKARPISQIYAIPFRLVTGSKHLLSTNLSTCRTAWPSSRQKVSNFHYIKVKSQLYTTGVRIRCNTILFNFYSSQKVFFISRDERVSIFPMKIFVKLLPVGCRPLWWTQTITLGKHDSLIEELSIS